MATDAFELGDVISQQAPIFHAHLRGLLSEYERVREYELICQESQLLVEGLFSERSMTHGTELSSRSMFDSVSKKLPLTADNSGDVADAKPSAKEHFSARADDDASHSGTSQPVPSSFASPRRHSIRNKPHIHKLQKSPFHLAQRLHDASPEASDVKEATEEKIHDEIARLEKQRRSLASMRMGARDLSAECLMKHPLCSMLTAAVIIFNSALLGWETEVLTSRDSTPLHIHAFNHFCSTYFLIELIIRIFGSGAKEFFQGEDRAWNLFDSALVLESVVATIIMFTLDDQERPGLVQSVKILKMLRIARLFRIFRFFKQLNILVIMILDSTKQVFWAAVLLIVVMYVFGVTLTSNCSDYLKTKSDDDDYLSDAEAKDLNSIRESFGHLSNAVYTLLQSMLGGVSWVEVCNPLFRVGIFSPMIFLVYVVFAMIAVLNIITGVFVDTAFESAQKQRDFMVEQEMQMKESFLKEIRKFFVALDVDGDSAVSFEEVVIMLEDPGLSAYFRVLGFDVHDAQRLFDLMDSDCSGTVCLEEFLDGCVRLKGSARSIDMHANMVDLKHVMLELEKVSEHVQQLCNERMAG
eukprot:TRINITY_DN24192_c0_g1_i1.p1 TRINITY_DN24192_c0_g1~~TRINITY_DN24192_c0_g1_i1.p1  ORF type:complete len:582 (+),score=115.95 TRINITY_DN24192_c0_g1_i1:94-1839(+)